MSVQEVLSRGPQGSDPEEEEPQPIGGYVGPPNAQGKTVALTGPQGSVPVGQQLAAQTPVYYKGFERTPGSWPVEDVALLQRHLSSLGLIKGTFRLGVWDAASAKAFSGVLSHANQQGTDWATALNGIATAEVQRAPAAPFEPLPYQPLDSDVSREVLATLAEARLDRELTADELNDLTGVINEFDRRRHDAEQDVSRAAYDAERTGTPEWMNMPALGPGEERSDLMTEEAMGAKIRAVFDQRYAREIAGAEEAAETAAAMPAGAGLFQTDWGQGAAS